MSLLACPTLKGCRSRIHAAVNMQKDDEDLVAARKRIASEGPRTQGGFGASREEPGTPPWPQEVNAIWLFEQDEKGNEKKTQAIWQAMDEVYETRRTVVGAEEAVAGAKRPFRARSAGESGSNVEIADTSMGPTLYKADFASLIKFAQTLHPVGSKFHDYFHKEGNILRSMQAVGEARLCFNTWLHYQLVGRRQSRRPRRRRVTRSARLMRG